MESVFQILSQSSGEDSAVRYGSAWECLAGIAAAAASTTTASAANSNAAAASQNSPDPSIITSDAATNITAAGSRGANCVVTVNQVS